MHNLFPLIRVTLGKHFAEKGKNSAKMKIQPLDYQAVGFRRASGGNTGFLVEMFDY